MSSFSTIRNIKSNHIDPITRRVHPAYIAAAAFVIIQVGIGIIFKIAQRADGKYAFSQSSSIAISEFCKGCLSTLFFWQECRRRRRKSEKLARAQQNTDSEDEEELEDLQLNEKSGADIEEAKHAPLASVHERELDDESSSSSVDEPKWQDHASEKIQIESYTVEPRLSLSTFVRRIECEISIETVFGMAHLALLYAVINNSVGHIMKSALHTAESFPRSSSSTAWLIRGQSPWSAQASPWSPLSICLSRLDNGSRNFSGSQSAFKYVVWSSPSITPSLVLSTRS